MNSPSLPLAAFGQDTAIVFSSDDVFVPYLGVCLRSLVAHSSPQNHYDIVVLHENITPHHQQLLKQCCQAANVSLRFIDISKLLDGKSFFVCMHLAKACYYRFCIPALFKHYKKAIYFDCDGVFLSDVAQLYDVDLGEKWLGAAHDPEVVRCLLHEPWWTGYENEVLKLTNRLDYFQSGVLIYNIAVLEKAGFEEKCWQTWQSIPRPQFADQDILNVAAQGHIHFLDLAWNVEWHIPIMFPQFRQQIPQPLLSQYLNALENPKFLHYCSSQKAWHTPGAPKAHHFWQYARQTPFYEEIIYRNILRQAQAEMPKPLPDDNKPLLFGQYYRCKILSKITWGKKRRHYKQKRDELHKRVRLLREMHKK